MTRARKDLIGLFETIKDLYINKKMNCSQLSKLFNIPASTIHGKLRRSGMKMMGIKEIMTGRKFTEEHKNNISKSKSGPNHPNWQKKRPSFRKGMMAENNPNWHGGSFYEKGYKFIKVGEGDGFNNHTKYKTEHIIVAEKALGRKMNRGEIVHHINGNKSDNRNSNLLICGRSYHLWLTTKMAQLYQKEHFGG